MKQRKAVHTRSRSGFVNEVGHRVSREPDVTRRDLDKTAIPKSES